MTKVNFRSSLGSYLTEFVSLKQSAGHPYAASIQHLMKFDAMLADEFPSATTVTAEIVNRWLELKSDLHPNGLLRSVTPVRQFTKYLNAVSIPAYIVPTNIPQHPLRYEPHIFTHEELKAFFLSIDQCPRSPVSPTRCYVIPVFFRMLYFCGMRSSESLFLTCGDVNLKTGEILIRESKGHKERRIWMHEDMLELCREYNGHIERLLPGRVPFFPNRKGEFYNNGTPDVWFHEFWDGLPVAASITGNPPRPHDLRHTFASNRLNTWVEDGKDVNSLYPFLSAWLGHKNFADTDYYLHLTASFYPELEKRMRSSSSIIPEVPYET